MLGFFANLTSLDILFITFTAIGAVLFSIRMILALIGFGHHDLPTDAHVDVGGAHDGLIDSDVSFKLLNLQGLTAFFLLFGLSGLALHRGNHLGELGSFTGALAVGLAAMAAMAKITQVMYRLQTSGNVSIREAVGSTGTIYLGIPAEGAGQVQVNIQNHWRIMDAIAVDRRPIKTGERVEVVDVADDRTLVVKRV